MERKRAGFCEVVVANTPQWVNGAALSDKTITKAIGKCVSLGLIDCVPGQPLSKGAATQVRRRTIEEIETGTSDIHLRDYTPATAREVVERLKGRTFIYDGEEVTPKIAAGKTGRISLSQPCPQNQHEKERLQRILTGLKPSEYLIEADYRQAEPTVAREILKRNGLAPANWPEDIYQDLATYLGQERNEVKSLVMPFMNAHSSIAHAVKWGILQKHFFYEFGKCLDEYKEQLRIRSKPRNGHRWHVHTLGRTRIEAFKYERPHRGRLFQWQVQGTVADIMNAALTDILDGEAKFGWRLLFPVHDSVYIVTRDPNHKEKITSILLESAKSLKVLMEVKGERKGMVKGS